MISCCERLSCADCQACDNVAYVVHVAHNDCWNLARGAGKTVRALYRFADNTRQILPPRNVKSPPIVTPFPIDLPTTTSLGILLKHVANRLPHEVQVEVERYQQGHLVSSLLHASQAISGLHGQSYIKAATRKPVVPPPLITSLYATTRRVFGLNYLAEIGFNGSRGSFVTTDNTNIRGIRFALGSHGIRALRVLYNKGEVSSWLGDPTLCWFGEVYGNDLARLSVLSDVSIPAASHGLCTNTCIQGFPHYQGVVPINVSRA